MIPSATSTHNAPEVNPPKPLKTLGSRMKTRLFLEDRLPLPLTLEKEKVPESNACQILEKLDLGASFDAGVAIISNPRKYSLVVAAYQLPKRDISEVSIANGLEEVIVVPLRDDGAKAEKVIRANSGSDYSPKDKATYFSPIFDKMEAHLKEANGRVLVCCLHGMSRSAMIMTLFIHRLAMKGLVPNVKSIQEAYLQVAAHKPDINMSTTYRIILGLPLPSSLEDSTEEKPLFEEDNSFVEFKKTDSLSTCAETPLAKGP